jgi:hypothetical protein
MKFIVLDLFRIAPAVVRTLSVDDFHLKDRYCNPENFPLV